LPGGTLLSPRADAAVTSAFNHLAGTILSTNSRSIEQVAEDMLRPMLKDWLDENLPPMVERLVREEIERVSRRR
jgi:cell pole-organizing protein PopZ